jgi:signal transduction histidine kinase
VFSSDGDIACDASWLGRAIGNLLDNAVVHSDRRERSGSSRQADVLLEVKSPGKVGNT